MLHEYTRLIEKREKAVFKHGRLQQEVYRFEAKKSDGKLCKEKGTSGDQDGCIVVT